jgi:hypothetical protein
MKRLICPVAVLFVLLGCATINYIGESYPPTQHVDLYFSEGDIKTEYTVVGRILATAQVDELLYSSDQFTQAILKKAREKGADGVVILGFEKVMTGTSASRNRTETTEEKGDKTVTHKHETVSSSIQEKSQIEALAIKYKSK